jgi:hypothetical protein
MKTLKLFYSYLMIVIKAIGKFLKFAFAPEITIGALAIFIYLFHSQFWGVMLFIWGILLTINELKQNKQ